MTTTQGCAAQTLVVSDTWADRPDASDNSFGILTDMRAATGASPALTQALIDTARRTCAVLDGVRESHAELVEKLARTEAWGESMRGIVESRTETLRVAEERIKRQQDRLGSMMREHEAFRDQVRAKAIEVRSNEDWCLEGLNDVLRELGLAEYNPRRSVSVTITAEVIVDADDDDEAIDRARYVIDGVEVSGNHDPVVADWSMTVGAVEEAPV